MQNLKATELTTVLGGAKQSDQITLQLTTLQDSLKDLTSNKTGNTGDNTFMLLAIMMMMRPQPTVVAAGGPPPMPVPIAAPAGPVVNINTRVRNW